MNDLIWAGIWAMLLKNAVDIAQMAGLALAWLIFAVMCLAKAGEFYDWIKQECDLERLLDTPQFQSSPDSLAGCTGTKDPFFHSTTKTAMSQRTEGGNMEGKTTFDFPEPEDVRKPITEPLKPIEMLEVPTEAEDAAQIATEEELEKIRDELEERAYEYSNKKHPYSFSDEETLRLYNLYNKVRGQSQKEQKAS